MTTTVGTLQAVFTADTSQFERGLSSVNKALNDTARNFGNKLSNLGNTISGVGGSIAALSAPFAASFGFAIKSAVDFEAAFADVVKTVGDGDEHLGELRDTIRQMSTDASNPLAGLDNAHVTLSGLIATGAQLGIATENLAEFAQVMGELSLATDLTAEEAGVLTARIANLTGLPVDEYRNFGSTLVALGNSMATTESEILNMSNRIASATALVGISNADMLAYSATMTSLGISAELGGTNFSKAIAMITTAVASGGDDLQAFAQVANMTATQFADSWQTDASGALLSFLQGLSQLSASEQILALEQLGLTGTEMQRVFLALAGNVELLEQGLDTANTAWSDNTALADEANNRLKTTAAQYAIVKNQVKDLAIELGDALLPTVKDLLKDVRPLIKTVGDWARQNPQLVKTIGIAAFAIAGLGAVLIPLGFAISSLAPLVSALGAAFALLFSPIGLVIAGLVALGVAYKTNLLGFGDAVNSIVASIKAALPSVKAFLNELVALLTQGDFVGAANMLKDKFIDLASSIIPALLQGIGDLASFVLNNIITPLAIAVSAYVSSGQLYDNLKALGNAMLSAIAFGIKAYAAYATFIYTNIIVPIADQVAAYIASGRLWENLKQLGNAMLVALETGVRLYANFYTFIFNNIVVPLAQQVAAYITQGGLYETLKMLGNAMLEAIKFGITLYAGYYTFIYDHVVAPLAQQITDAVSSVFDTAKALGEAIMRGIGEGVRSLVGELEGIIKSAINDLVPSEINLRGSFLGREIDAGTIRLPKPFEGYRTGTAFTGFGALNDVAGVVHRREAVVPASGMRVYPSPSGLRLAGAAPAGGSSIVINGDINLPNVRNSTDFVRELQRTASRMANRPF